jgi:hypothetical protein
MQAVKYRSYTTPNTETRVALALERERRRNQSLRKMLLAQSIYAVLLTVACVAVAIAH